MRRNPLQLAELYPCSGCDRVRLYDAAHCCGTCAAGLRGHDADCAKRFQAYQDMTILQDGLRALIAGTAEKFVSETGTSVEVSTSDATLFLLSDQERKRIIPSSRS